MRLIIGLFYTSILFIASPAKTGIDSIPSPLQELKPLFSFGLIADVQYCDCEPRGSRYYRSSLTKLEEAIDSFKKDSVEFIINLGDLIDKDYSSYKPVMNILDSSGLQTWHCIGNHDYQIKQGLKNKIAIFDSAKVAYYSFIFERFRFIFLDGNEISTYSADDEEAAKVADELIRSLKNDGAINAFNWNGGISGCQLKWLINQLEDAMEKNEQVIVNCHFPVFPENVHNLLNYKELLTILEDYNHVIAWFNGHNHAGNYGIFNGIHFITFKGMVETENTNSYAIIEIYPHKFCIKGNGRQESRCYPF